MNRVKRRKLTVNVNPAKEKITEGNNTDYLPYGK
jgi:hypothetical protein